MAAPCFPPVSSATASDPEANVEMKLPLKRKFADSDFQSSESNEDRSGNDAHDRPIDATIATVETVNSGDDAPTSGYAGSTSSALVPVGVASHDFASRNVARRKAAKGGGSGKMTTSSNSSEAIRQAEGKKLRAALVPTCLPEDGFSWLKYGEKPLMNQPNCLRSYFRCAGSSSPIAAPCTAKRTVDWRVDTQPASFSVTYAGQHNHNPVLAGSSPAILVSHGGSAPTASKACGSLSAYGAVGASHSMSSVVLGGGSLVRRKPNHGFRKLPTVAATVATVAAPSVAGAKFNEAVGDSRDDKSDNCGAAGSEPRNYTDKADNKYPYNSIDMTTISPTETLSPPATLSVLGLSKNADGQYNDTQPSTTPIMQLHQEEQWQHGPIQQHRIQPELHGAHGAPNSPAQSLSTTSASEDRHSMPDSTEPACTPPVSTATEVIPTIPTITATFHEHRAPAFTALHPSQPLSVGPSSYVQQQLLPPSLGAPTCLEPSPSFPPHQTHPDFAGTAQQPMCQLQTPGLHRPLCHQPSPSNTTSSHPAAYSNPPPTSIPHDHPPPPPSYLPPPSIYPPSADRVSDLVFPPATLPWESPPGGPSLFPQEASVPAAPAYMGAFPAPSTVTCSPPPDSRSCAFPRSSAATLRRPLPPYAPLLVPAAATHLPSPPPPPSATDSSFSLGRPNGQGQEHGQQQGLPQEQFLWAFQQQQQQQQEQQEQQQQQQQQTPGFQPSTADGQERVCAAGGAGEKRRKPSYLGVVDYSGITWRHSEDTYSIIDTTTPTTTATAATASAASVLPTPTGDLRSSNSLHSSEKTYALVKAEASTGNFSSTQQNMHWMEQGVQNAQNAPVSQWTQQQWQPALSPQQPDHQLQQQHQQQPDHQKQQQLQYDPMQPACAPAFAQYCTPSSAESPLPNADSPCCCCCSQGNPLPHQSTQGNLELTGEATPPAPFSCDVIQDATTYVAQSALPMATGTFDSAGAVGPPPRHAANDAAMLDEIFEACTRMDVGTGGKEMNESSSVRSSTTEDASEPVFELEVDPGLWFNLG